MSLRFGEPHKRVLCIPHARGEECGSSSAVPCPPPYSEETQKPSASSKRLLNGLDDDDPFFFGEKACRFLP
jgi:hypothetical protein